MRRFALVLLVITAVAATAQANATKGRHRCQRVQGYGRGRVLFPFLFERSGYGGYTQVVTGFRKTSSRRAIADTHADWGIIQGECGQNGVIRDCKSWAAGEQIRYRTSDWGRHWRPVRFHRKARDTTARGPTRRCRRGPSTTILRCDPATGAMRIETTNSRAGSALGAAIRAPLRMSGGCPTR